MPLGGFGLLPIQCIDPRTYNPVAASPWLDGDSRVRNPASASVPGRFHSSSKGTEGTMVGISVHMFTLPTAVDSPWADQSLSEDAL